MKKYMMISMLIFLALTMIGCRKFNEPKYVEIGSNETAFVIPLEGDSLAQDSFESVAFLRQSKVAARRIQVPRRWKKDGYLWFSGDYIDTVRVIVVDRAPKTRDWEAGNANSIWVESRDSVGFSIDITIVAQINPEDVPQFLYLYPSMEGNDRLDGVLDTEVRAFIQDQLARQCAEYDMDILRTMKNQIMTTVRDNTIPYFAERGITITTIGMGSGFAYESTEIQRAIDRVVEAQQDKASALAEQEAQTIRNATDIERAEAAKHVAQLQADARRYEIEQAVQSGSDYIELLRIQAFQQWIEKWNGVRPSVEMMNGGDGSGAGTLIQIPSTPPSE